jgi:hypothetical protein
LTVIFTNDTLASQRAGERALGRSYQSTSVEDKMEFEQSNEQCEQETVSDDDFDIDVKFTDREIARPLGWSGCVCTGGASGTHNCC